MILRATLLVAVTLGASFGAKHKKKSAASAAEMKKDITGHLRETHACDAERDKPGTPAKVSVSWTITTAGQVADVAVKHRKGDAGDPGLEGCLVEAISRWTFPSPKHDQRAHYTFQFGAPPPQKTKKRRGH
jgi:outer membrane biosynthesis protein TonB